MKKILCFCLLIISLSNCKEEIVEEENPCPPFQIRVEIGQKISLLNTEGNWLENVDYAHLELLPTNANYEPLYKNFKQVPNSFEAIFVENENKKYIQLYLGQTSEMKDINKDTCYFILKVGENTFHRIKTVSDTACHNFLMQKFYYNDIEYVANSEKIINIIVN